MIQSAFPKAGEAIFFSQMLELNLRILISILNEYKAAKINPQLLISSDRRTLGQLVQDIKKCGNMDDAGADLLAAALNARNYVAHEFFANNVITLSRKDSCPEILEQLNTKTLEIAKATAMTVGFIKAFRQAFGIGDGDILVRQESLV